MALLGTLAACAATDPPSIRSGGVVNGASFVAGIAPSSWITIYGTNLAASTILATSSDLVNGYLPTALGGTTVTINGKPAYLYYVSPTQINLESPADTTTGSVAVVVTTAGGSASANATLASVMPGLFTYGNYAAAVRPSDSTIINGTGAAFAGYATSPTAKPGDVLELFATGLGATLTTVTPGLIFSGAYATSDTPTVRIGGTSATVLYSGLVGAGLYQINIQVPSTMSSGTYPLVVSQSQTTSSASTLLSIAAGSQTGTTTTLATSASTATIGASVTLTATVTPAAATGVVNFYAGSTLLGTSTIGSGTAALSTSFSTAGTYSVTARYAGDTTYAASASSTVAVVATAGGTSGAASTITLSALPGSAYPGSMVVLTASVSPAVATGKVTFYNDTAAVGSATVSNGTAVLATHFAKTGSYALKASYSGDSSYAASISGTVAETVTAGSYALDLSSYTAITGNTTVTTDSSHTVAYKLYQNVVYVANPVDTKYQSMNIFVPTSVDGVAVSGKPILIDIGVGGYMSSSTWGQSSVGSTNGKYALGKGYVVVEVGCRGRDNASNGTYYGKAPAAMVDLKAAVRFLRYNAQAGSFTGDVDHMISSGGSAGGALSSLLGASGNSSLYYSYLAEVGAADADDNIFAVGAWSPITNLDHADMAYEWEYGSLNYGASSGGGTPGTPPSGSTSEASTAATVNATVSSQLQTKFKEYQDGLALVDMRGSHGTLTSGNLNDYLLTQYLQPSAAAYLQSLSASAQSSYLSSNSWITWDSSTGKATFTFANYVSHIGSRGKSVPAFDSFFDLSTSDSTVNTSQSAEVVEFGNSSTNARHFTDFSSQYVGGSAISSELQTVVNMMNPMYYVMQARSGDKSGVARYWYIRDGSTATDTSIMVIMDLATALDNVLGTKYVNAAEDWDKGHNVNTDPAGFSTWTTKVVADN